MLRSQEKKKENSCSLRLAATLRSQEKKKKENKLTAAKKYSKNRLFPMALHLFVRLLQSAPLLASAPQTLPAPTLCSYLCDEACHSMFS
jgi:hypothetical protein